jgi:hypothetical protein
VREEDISFSVTASGLAGYSILSGTAEETDDPMAVVINVREPVAAEFSVRFLTKFVKATPLAERVTLRINERDFMTVEFDLGLGVGHLKYLLAAQSDGEEEATSSGSAADGMA